MIELIVYSLLILLTCLAVFDLIRHCWYDKEAPETRLSMWSAAYDFVKNTLKDMQTLKKEEVPPASSDSAYDVEKNTLKDMKTPKKEEVPPACSDSKPFSISETV